MNNELFLMGSETEYASIVLNNRGTTSLDDLKLCLKIVRKETAAFAVQPAAFLSWKRREPHQFPDEDVRKFAAALKSGALRKQFKEKEGMSINERLSCELGVITPEGGRAYIDMGHIEYSSPECPDPYELIRCERNFAAVLARTQGKFFEETGRRIFFFKNNSDGQGHSYSHHLNFCVPRGLFGKIVSEDKLPESIAWATFLATSVIFSGTGKIGAEKEWPLCDFQISQRADFFSFLYGLNTSSERSLVNTRDEPLADPKKYGRLHVIFDDTPMAEATLFLSVGTKALVLKMLEDKKCADKMPVLKNPVGVLSPVSRDLNCAKRYEFIGRTMTAAEAQLAVWRLAREFFRGAKAVWIADLLEMWGDFLRKIGRDPRLLREWLDWPFKLSLLKKSGLAFDDPDARGIDLLYHGVDPVTGVFLRKEEKGQIKRLTKNGGAPVLIKDTRAFFRGFLAREKGHLLEDISWETAAFCGCRQPFLLDPFGANEKNFGCLTNLGDEELLAALFSEERRKGDGQ